MWLDRAVKWLLPREEHFFDLLEKGAHCAAEAGKLLEQCCSAHSTEARQEFVVKLRDVEHQADKVIMEVYEALNKTFVTPLDRSDIYALATELENVVDRINATASQSYVHAMEDLPGGAEELAKCIRQATEEMHGAVALLRHLRELHEITKRCEGIHKLEHDGDMVFRGRIADMFKNEKDAIRLIKHKEFLEGMEYTLDVCDDVANALENVVIKNA